MERNFKRIADELKLPRESRERIRSQLASRQKQSSEDIRMKKSTLKSRVLLVAAAVVIIMALTLTAAAVGDLFRNDIIVSSVDDIPMPSENDAPGAGGVTSPNGNPPFTLEEMGENGRFKSDDWDTGNRINGGVASEYFKWDSVEVLSSDPALRSRRVSRKDGAEKMEYTAENPVNLLDTLTGRVTFDLEWVNEHYDYVPDADLSYVVSDKKGNYINEYFAALYAKKDRSGYVKVNVENSAEGNYGQSYIVDGSYETAYYYTSTDGYDFLITMHNGNVWVSCNMSHAQIRLYGAYLTTDEVENILDHLSLSIAE